jgi:hypothetical protein
MKEMNGSKTLSIVASVVIVLLIATGSAFSLAAEKGEASKAVFYVA